MFPSLGLSLLLLLLTTLNPIQGHGEEATAAPDIARCPGSTVWKEDCNSCFCDKQVPFCLALDCKLPPGVVTVPCKSGSTWKKDCNLCVCKDGIPVCSRLSCPTTSKGALRKEKCAEGKVWRTGCNDCFCFFGVVACTVQPCASSGHTPGFKNWAGLWKPTLMFEVGESQNSYCLPGTSWKNKCNYCFCSYGFPACTMKDCSLEEAFSSTTTTRHMDKTKAPKLLTEFEYLVTSEVANTIRSTLRPQSPTPDRLMTSTWAVASSFQASSTATQLTSPKITITSVTAKDEPNSITNRTTEVTEPSLLTSTTLPQTPEETQGPDQ